MSIVKLYVKLNYTPVLKLGKNTICMHILVDKNHHL